MNSTRWQRVQQIVEEAEGMPSEERVRWISEQTGDDPELWSEVKGILSNLDSTNNFLEDAIGMAAARIAAGQELSSGDRIGPYRIASTIGHGGMGIVYCAERSDDQYRQKVAIKVVRTGWGATEELFSRFRAERQILACIAHPNICRLLDGGITGDGLPFLVMEHVEGVSLDQWLATNGQSLAPPLSVRLELFRKLCSAIHYAHQNLIVHRDLKPSNVLVTADGTPKLLDFGIAKLLDPESNTNNTIFYTRPAERLMTPEYASPEQIRGETVTTATDVHGLGVLLYEILTGTRPFRLGNLSPVEIERIICETQPRPPSSVRIAISNSDVTASQSTRNSAVIRRQTDLDRIVLKAMHKQPLRRYASAADLAADVQRYQEGFPISARPDSFAYRTTRLFQRNKLASAVTAFVMVIVIALSIVSWIQARRARREAASAEAVASYLTNLFQFTRPDETQGRSVSARDILDSGTNQLNTEWKGDPAIKARLLHTLGMVYFRLGDLNQASTLLHQARSIQSSLGDTDTRESTDTAVTLGNLLTNKGAYAEAEQQFRTALAENIAAYGKNSIEAAPSLDGLAGLYWTMGDFEKARYYQQQAVDVAERKLAPEDSDLLTYRNNLEVVLANQGDYRAAQPIAQDLLRIRQRTNGIMNSSTLAIMNNYGFLLVMAGHLHEGKAVHNQTLEAKRKLFGKEHPDIATSLIALGDTAIRENNLEEAKPLLTEGLRMAMKLEGPESLDTAIDEDEMGILLLQQGELNEARQFFERALAVRLSKSTPSQPRLADSYDHLGLLALAEGKLPEARTQIEKALGIRQSFYKRDNDAVASSYLHLGRLQLAAAQPAKAEAYFQRAISIAQTLFGEDPHPIKVEALEGLSLGESALGREAQTKSSLAEALKMQKALGILPNPSKEQSFSFNNLI